MINGDRIVNERKWIRDFSILVSIAFTIDSNPTNSLFFRSQDRF